MSNQLISELKLQEYYKVSLELVKKCGPLFLEGFLKPKTDYEVKSAFYDLVTVYDQEIEVTLTAGLLKAFPESRIIGEEALSVSQAQAELTDAPTWIIDPIDGTNNFVRKIPHCCISVGLAVNKELVVGIIYNPSTSELYSAWKGHGAFLNGQPISVASGVVSIQQAIVGFEMSLIVVAKGRDKNVKRLGKLASNATATRSFGSAALTLCYIAKGCCDAYHVENLKPWDLAAGAIILTEAGGRIYHTSGGKFEVLQPDCVCACSEELAQDVIQLIAEADRITEYTFQ
ncbi:inositol monophosphatase 2 [Drosophila guanche]|uniref:Inositol-1-monophosphatase n=1 Tax=Drosophila guanche TaxID=7266 RepID=A0A3B0J8Z9_DROGU|nr:inositol monophosphatase 2 [Drosophila guanche]SPP76793.1 blast:Inositol monophosphatase ttx-7 [Drosophila guanche]